MKEDGPVEPESIWSKLIDGVETVAGLVCKFKIKLIDIIKSIFNIKKRLLLNNPFKIHHFFQDIKSKIDSFFGKGKDWVGKQWDEIKDFGEKIANHFVVFLQEVKSTLSRFLQKDFVDDVINMAPCIIKESGLILGVKSVVLGVVTKIKQVAEMAAGNYAVIADIVFSLVCNFPLFRAAFTALAKGINEKEVLLKFRLIGSFVGNLFRGIFVN